MRNILLAVLLFRPVEMLFSALVCWWQLRQFEIAVQVLRSKEDLQQLKSIAKSQMYVCLLDYALTAIQLGTWVVGTFIFGTLGWMDLALYVVLPYIVAFVLILCLVDVGIASRVRNTEAANDKLKEKRDHIAKVWVEKLLPDW